jgi:uncharacterized protein (TIGR03000 family)
MGCWGCAGCAGCTGPWVNYSGYFGGGYGGYYGGYYGYAGCFGCYGNCWGCYGGYAGYYGCACAAPAAAPAPGGGGGDSATTPMSEAEKAAVRELLQKLREGGRDIQAQRGSAPARVTVNAPAGARIYVDGVRTAERSFNTPALQPGREYYYDLRVEMVRNGRAQSQARRVTVAAGRQVTVDFTAAPPPAGVARR